MKDEEMIKYEPECNVTTLDGEKDVHRFDLTEEELKRILKDEQK